MKIVKTSILFLIISLMIYSCIGYKQSLIKGTGNLKMARINAIIDFSNKHYKKHSTFFVDNCSDKNNVLFCLDIIPNLNKWSVDTVFKIGEYNRYFPNDFYIYKNKLFMWVDENKVYNKETVNVLNDFNILDSINYKIQIGEISPNQILPEFVIDHGLKSVNYFICKNDISKYKTVKSQWILEPNDFPIVKCD